MEIKKERNGNGKLIRWQKVFAITLGKKKKITLLADKQTLDIYLHLHVEQRPNKTVYRTLQTIFNLNNYYNKSI